MYYEDVNRNESTSAKVGASMWIKDSHFVTHLLWVATDGPFSRVEAQYLKRSIFGDNENECGVGGDGLGNHQRGGGRSRHILCRQVYHTR